MLHKQDTRQAFTAELQKYSGLNNVEVHICLTLKPKLVTQGLWMARWYRETLD